MDREELDTLITALTNCESAEDGACPEDCPMKDDEWKREGRAACRALVDDEIIVPAALIRCTVELLQAQEARVMTFEEVNCFLYGTPYIIETNKPGEKPHLMYGLYSHQGVNGCFYFAFTDVRSHFFDADYGKRWRCWTSSPTDAQREAVKWE